MKGLFQRGRIWWLRYSAGGRQYFETLGTDDESAAIEAARDILENPDRLDARAWDREVKEYLADRVAKNKMSANVFTNRASIFKAFALRQGIAHPREVTPRVISRWYDALLDEVEAESAATYVRWMKVFLQTLVDARKLRSNPVDGLEIVEPEKKPRKPFCSREQVLGLLANAPDDEMRFILYAGFHCGLRREEIGECRVIWFDLQEGLLHLQRSETWHPKDKDDRTIPMTQEFTDFMRHFIPKKAGTADFILAPKKKVKTKWRYRYDFRKRFVEYMAKQGLGWVTPHTMRRTFASQKVSAGVSLYKVAVWLGDLEKVVQDRYGFLIPKDSDIERGI